MIELTQEELKQHFSEPIFGQIAETADTLGMECYVAVSYTHLDVYKRHETGCLQSFTVEDADCQAFFFYGLGHRFAENLCCLLYTSRCV